MKKRVLQGLSGLFLLASLVFTGCENFLTGDEIKEAVVEAIEYGNAPYYTIRVEAIKGTGTIKGNEEVSKRVSDTFTVRFEPEEDHKFIKWEAVIPNISSSEKIEDYIVFEDAGSLETKVTLKKANSSILIRPVCPAKLLVTNFNLSDSDRIFPRDSSIALTFNKELNEACLNNITVSIPNLPDDKTYADYFKSPEKNGGMVLLYADIDWDNVSEEDFIPIEKNEVKTIQVKIPEKSIYYTNTDYSESINIYNEKELIYEYRINSETDKAPVFSVNFDGSHGKFSPSKGNYTVKQFIENAIEFEPDSDYEFIRWQIYDENTDEELPNSTYLRVSDVNDRKSSYMLISVPAEEDGVVLAIRPVVVERPQTISVSPQRSSAGVYRDTSIQVMFDYDMDESSIYYTDDELRKFVNEMDLPYINVTELAEDPYPLDRDGVLYFETADGTKKFYGYQLGGERFFKNISIVNKQNKANIVDRFSYPIFQNASTLSIPVDRSRPLVAGINVMVTLDKAFSYNLDGKPVSMSQAEKWVYLVNGRTDIEKPEVKPSFIIKDSSGNTLTASSTAPTSSVNINTLNFFKKGEFKLAAEIHDNTAPDSNFTIRYKKILNSNYAVVSSSSFNSKTLDYTTCFGEDAECGVRNDSNVLEASDFKLDGLSDGVYGIYFEFKDGSGNYVTYPTDSGTSNTYPSDGKLYYFSLDATKPAIEAPKITSPEDDTSTLSLDWSESGVTGVKDYQKAYFEYKKYDDSSFSDENKTPDIPKTSNTTTITNLAAGTRYSIRAHYFDVAGNEKIVDTSAYTRPNAPKTATLSTAYGTSVTVTAQKPEEGLCSNLSVRYKKTDESTWSSRYTITTGTNGQGSSTISGLDKGSEYEFEVCSYDSLGGKYGPSYKNGSDYLKFKTIPEAPASVTDDSGSSTNSIKVSWTAPVNGTCSGYYVYHSTTSNFTSATTTKSSAQSASSTNYTITGLTPGKKYYVKVESYYGDSGNADSLAKSSYSYTKSASVTGLTLAGTTKNSLTVSWTKPNNDYISYYYVYYKNINASTWSTTTCSSSETSCKLDGLSGGEKYNVRIYTYSYNYSNYTENNSEGWQICPNTVTNLVAEKVSDTSLKLTWSTPGGNYDGYNIYYSTTDTWPSSPNKQITKGTTESTITGLTSKAFYNIKVETYIGSGSLKSAETTTCSLKLDGVKNVKATATATNKIKLSWTNPASTAYDGIRIYRGSSSSPLTTITSKSTTSYEDSSLSTNTQYTYKIETYKIDQGEEFSTYSTKKCYTFSALATSVTSVSKKPGEITVSWTNPSSSNYSDICIYNGTTCVTTITDKSTKSYTVQNLTGGTSYSISVRTRNGDSIENTGYNTASACTMPSEVTNLSWSVTYHSQTSVYLNWTKPSGNYTGYRIYYKLYGDSSWIQFKPSSYTNGNIPKAAADPSSGYSHYTVTGLTAGKTYIFRVETYSSSVSNDSSYTYPTCYGYTQCTPVSSVSIKARTTNSITFEWKNPTSDYSRVRMYYKKSTDISYSYKDMTTGNTSYELTNLNTGTSYDVYFISYYYSSSYPSQSTYTGCSSNSPYKLSTKPAVPTNLSVSRTASGGIKLSWTAPSTGSKTGYYIYDKLSTSSSWTYQTSTTATSVEFTNTKFSNSTKYDFCIATYYDQNGETVLSDKGSSSSFYTMPSQISSSDYSVYCDDTMGTVVIRWKNPSCDLGGVNVYLGTGTSYAAYTTNVAKNTYSTCAVSLPDYYRGKSYKIRIAPYHNLNGSEMEGPETTLTFYSSDTKLLIKGSRYEYSSMTNVITSSYTIKNNNNRTGGAFTKNRIVTLSPYSIGTYEVTRQLFNAVMGYDPSTKTQNVYYPVNHVTWYEAITYCNRLSVLQGLTPYYTISGINSDWWGTATLKKGTGTSSENIIYIPTSNTTVWDAATYNTSANGYRLPTEAQWEFAGRGGSTTADEWKYEYSGSNTLANVGVTNTSSPKVVGSLNSNRLGLYDMTGNVWEWLTDWNNNVPDGTFTDPYCGRNTSLNENAKPSTMKYNNSGGVLLKGAGFKTSSDRQIDYNSQKDYPTGTADDFGFRVCRNKTMN